MITIAICTWNRAILLARALQSVAEMRIEAGVEWEVIVVDNNSTDNTRDIVLKAAEQIPVRYVFEGKQGISHARNRAMNEARGEMILFTDDDCRVAPDIVNQYHKAMESYPCAAMFAGTVKPEFEKPPPLWIQENLDILAPVFAVLERGAGIRELGRDEGVFTANLLLRTELGRQFLFDPDLGAVADSKVRGEDIEFVDRFRMGGNPVIWVGDAMVRHHIPTTRMSKRYIEEMFVAEGVLSVRLDSRREAVTLFGYPRWALRKYIEATAQRLVFCGFGGRRWVKAMRESAEMRGLLEEWSKTCTS